MKKHTALIVLLMMLAPFFMTGVLEAAEMEDYCTVPPYVKRDIPPNIKIIFDNSYINGHAVYTGPAGFEDELSSLYYGTDIYQYDYTTEYGGYFNSNLWYYYDGSKFVPSDPDDTTNPNRADAVFEGNLLNRMAMSRYDLIEGILEGGKSTSRQTNVNLLVGENDGTWDPVIYKYTGTDGIEYVCEFEVNVGGKGNLTIRDSVPYYSDAEVTCGLIQSPRIGPDAASRFIADASGVYDAPAYAALTKDENEATQAVEVAFEEALVKEEYRAARAEQAAADPETTEGGPRSRTFNFLNTILSSIATPAYAAAPVKIITPNADYTALPNGTRYLLYDGYGFVAAGGDGCYKWSIDTTGGKDVLPAGLTLDADTAVISGTPTEAGTFELYIKVQDYDYDNAAKVCTTSKNGLPVTRIVTLYIAGSTLYMDYPTPGQRISDAVEGEAYDGFQAHGGGGKGEAFFTWSATNLPPGMAIDPDGSVTGSPGFIYGTPTASGTYTPTIKLTDGIETASIMISIEVIAAPGALMLINPQDGDVLPDIYLDDWWSYYGFAVNGTGTYNWNVTGLPSFMDWWSWSNRLELWFSPWGADPATLVAGTYPFTITVSDGVDTKTANVTVTVIESEVKITWPPEDFPEGCDGCLYDIGDTIIGQYYDNRFQAKAQGGLEGNYQWSAVGLPTGLEIDTWSGRIYGTIDPLFPTGQYLATISVTDGFSSDSQDVYIWAWTPSSISIVNVWDGDWMPNATLGGDYPGYSIGTFYGYGQATWSATGLPAGLWIDSQSGLVQGMVTDPAAVGIYNSPGVTFTVQTTDPLSGITYSDSVTLYIEVETVGTAPVIQTPANGEVLPDAFQYIWYYQPKMATAVGGAVQDSWCKYTWSATGMPTGMWIDCDGSFGGTPEVAGTYNITIKVQDLLGQTDSVNVTLTVHAREDLVITYPPDTFTLPPATVGKRYVGFQPAVSGGTGRYQWYMPQCADATCKWGVPFGMSYNPNSGYISGLPAVGTEGTYDLWMEVWDGTDWYGVWNITLEVLPSTFTPNTEDFNIRICVGDYDNNCTTAGSGVILKEGLLQLYFEGDENDPSDDLAQFGLVDFRLTLNPAVEECTDGVINEASFHTAVENAVPVGTELTLTPLIDGMHEALKAYEGDPQGPGTCDPFAADDKPCRRNFVLMLTDGRGAETGTRVYDVSGISKCADVQSDLAKNACYGYNVDLRSTSVGINEKAGKQNVSTYVVHVDPSLTNADILKETASSSGGLYYEVTDPSRLKDTLTEALQDIIKRAASGTAASVLASAEGKGANMLQAVYYPRKRFPDSATGLEKEIAWIGRLANYWLAIKPWEKEGIVYEEDTGDLVLNLLDDNPMELYFDNVEEQVKVERWDNGQVTTIDGREAIVHLNKLTPDSPFEEVHYLWEAGLNLWKRDLASQERRIYVNLNGTATTASTEPMADGSTDSGLYLFDTLLASDATMQGLLDVTDDDFSGSTQDEAQDVITFIHGYPENTTYYPDGYPYRSRSVKVDLNNDNDTLDTDPLGTGDPNENETEERVWKLGDILNSTPRLIYWNPVGDYAVKDGDNEYLEFLKTETYKTRGMVLSGGNDGMLHAFRLGQPLLPTYPDPDTFNAMTSDQYDIIAINSTHLTAQGTDIGEEAWAFIPLNALPYLKYQLRNGYCHIYSVDLTPHIIDVAIGNDPDPETTIGQTGAQYQNLGTCSESEYWNCRRTRKTWRTVVIGAMRFGGACKNAGSTATVDLNDDSVIDDKDIVQTPVSDVGYSSYFAIDVTDPEDPKFLWEFSSPELGYTFSGPSLTRMGVFYDLPWDETSDPHQDKTLNGRWFIIVGSGPTGPIVSESGQYQNLARSDQNLKFFVLDAKTGERVRTIDTGVEKAFSSGLIEVTADPPWVPYAGAECRWDFQDDVFYAGYTKYDASTGKWNNGGIGRVLTHENINPDLWEWVPLMDNVGPVVSSPEVAFRPGPGTVVTPEGIVGCAKSGNEMWIFFGTGRYFYELNLEADDAMTQRHVIGVKEPCAGSHEGDAFRVDCVQAVANGDPSSLTMTNLIEITDALWYSHDTVRQQLDDPAQQKYGWYHELYAGGLTNIVDERTGDPVEIDYGAERIITDPVFNSTTGIIYFASYMPYRDGCEIGGDTFALDFYGDTGTVVAAGIGGTAIVQSSTGSIEKVDLGAEGGAGGDLSQPFRSRRIKGVPPMAQGFTVFSPPRSKERILHIRER